MILDRIAESTRRRVEARKKESAEEAVRAAALALPKGDFRFEKVLAAESLSFICEVKRASPSKGLIARDFPYLDIAREYERAGAAAISVLTEPEFFQGGDRYLTEIRGTVSIPLLRKDFTVDPYQLYEAKLIGADAVLIICALHTEKTVREYLEICDVMGLSALVETHTAEEILLAQSAGARIIGVNNRDLKTFQVNLDTCIELRQLVSPDVLFVAESGIRDASDVARLRSAGMDAVLIGETLMKADDKKRTLEGLRCGSRFAD